MARAPRKKSAANRATPPGRVRTNGGRAGQSEISGTREIDESVEAKAIDYATTRDERMALTKAEKTKQIELLELMDAKKLKVYPMGDGRTVILEETVTRKAKVVSPKGDNPEEAD